MNDEDWMGWWIGWDVGCVCGGNVVERDITMCCSTP